MVAMPGAQAPPFVGRSRELKSLHDWLAAARAGTPAAVMLGGEAGVGKSRLLEQFTDAALEAGAHALSGACIQLGASGVGGGVAYAPLVEALRLFDRKHGEGAIRDLAGPAATELGGLVSDYSQTEPAPGSQLRVFRAVLRL